jgi:predicted MPP superfamily phosphohydrolase
VASAPEAARRGPDPERSTLPGGSAARERGRHLFHPRRGWIRSTERALNNFLARSMWPALPAAARLYDAILERDLGLSEATIELTGLPEASQGLRLLLITDVHAGPFVTPAALQRAFERLLLVEPDAVLLGGDLTTCRAEELETHRTAFHALDAPLGVWAVLGNHDHYAGAERLRGRLAELGIATLHNEGVVLGHGADGLSLAGVDDLLHGRPDLDRALEGLRPPVVLLSHNPDVLFDAARRDVALVLSGHTHGGQIRVPRLPPLVRQSRYRLDEGRYFHAGTQLVVSRGLGAVGLPWRAGCPPEAVLLTLTGTGRAA